MKTCSKCKQEKNLDQYSKLSSQKDGKDYYCKACRFQASTNTRYKNKVKCTWNECERPNWAHGLCRMHLGRKLKGNLMDQPIDGQYKYKNIKAYYKLTKEQYDEMAKGGCYICGSKDYLNVDHDHACCSGSKSCGKCVRGIVCQSCNILLGRLEKGTIALQNSTKPKLLQYILDYELKKQSLG